MRTIEILEFNELTEVAKERAINQARDKNLFDCSFYYDEAHESVKEFHKVFGTKQGIDSFLDVRTGHIDDNILELSGVRLRTYIINNYYHKLYNRKEYTKGDKTRKSRIFFVSDGCPLTGVCYDCDLLEDFYNIIEKYDHKGTTLKDMFENAFHKLTKTLKSEEEYYYSDEGISEELENNNYEFTTQGNLI